MSSDQTATVVVAAVVLYGGRVLIQRKGKSNNPEIIGRWECPGGKVNLGEDFANALRREVREELSLEVLVGRPLHSQINTYSDGVDYLVLFYHCTLRVPPMSLIGEDFRFVLPNELKNYNPLPGMVEAVSRLGTVTTTREEFSFIQNDVRQQSSDDTLRILTYEVGRMNELVYKGKVYGTKPRVARNVPEFLLKHQTADALSMLRMFCEHMEWDESEMRTLGEERYLGRMEDIKKYGKGI